jgi:parallel beta-helix repeat protein
MKRKWTLTLALLALGTILFGTYLLVGSAPTLVGSAPTRYSEYPPAPHSNIAIGGDGDFTRVGAGSGCECVRSGVGSDIEPYVISSWVINASGVDGISIYGTTAHFVIEGVYVYGDSSRVGIRLSDINNGRIESSSIANSFMGIHVERSSNLQFVNNSVSKSTYGIQLETSDGNTLSQNRVEGASEVSIFVRGSDNVVENNEVTGGQFGGINIDGTPGSANKNTVEGNVVTGSLSYGIAMWRATNCVLRGNIARGNGDTGIMLTDSSNNNLIEGNTVTGNKGGGILILGESTGNTIKENTAKNNGDGVNTVDLYDASSNNIWQNNTYDTKMPESIN